MTENFPKNVEVVIIGGGIIGCSTAYHLAKAGCKNVVLIERNELTSGTTWHSAAQVRQIRSSKNLTQMVQYSTQLYASLEEETSLPTGWSQCGSISIATNKERLTHIQRQASLARAFNIEVHEITAQDVQKHWPLAYTDDIIAAVYSPTDGRVDPKLTSYALIAAAKNNGVQVFEHCAATGIKTQNGHVTAVETELGTIQCEKIVDCAGAWGRQVANMASASAPMYACEHLYIVTEPINEITKPLPIMSDHDGWLYMRDHEGGLLVGCFEQKAKPLDINTLPANFSFGITLGP